MAALGRGTEVNGDNNTNIKNHTVMKSKDKKAKEYADRIATSGQFTLEECIQMAKDDYLTGYEAAEKEARDRAVEAFRSALSIFAQGGISNYEARLIFKDKYDNENS